MSNRHELQAFDYVNHPYAAVRDILLASPLAVFRHATTAAATVRHGTGIGGELHAKLGPVEVAGQVAIDILTTEETRSPEGKPRTKLVLELRAARRASLFPTMRAELSIYPLTATETQLELAGTYEPPLGLMGEALDAIAMHGIAEQSITGFVRDVATFLRGMLSRSLAQAL